MPFTEAEQAALWAKHESVMADWLPSRLGISEKFMAQLPHDDDWTTIIKLHAMIEATLNQMILSQFDNPELAKVIGRLETSNPKTGKLAFIKAFNILPHENIQFIRRLSELRNDCVHEVRNFSFDLSAYVAKLDEKATKRWIELLTFESSPTIKGPGGVIKFADIVIPAFRIALIGTVYQILTRAWIHEQEREECRLELEHQRLAAEQFYARSQSTPKE